MKSGQKCPKCGKALQFAATDETSANCYWVLVGPRDGTPTLARPLLADQPLAVGSDKGCWLRINGNAVQPKNTELRVDVDRRVHVRHIAEEGRTWIDRAAVLEGVLQFDNELRVGQNVIRLSTTSTLQRLAAADAAPVVIESDESGAAGGEGEFYEEESRAPRRQRPGLLADFSTGQKVRALISVLIVVVAGYFTARLVFFPKVTDDMPTYTVYTCPVDGTKVRAKWSDGPPKCPECGQIIAGAVDYTNAPKKSAPPPAKAAVQPTTSQTTPTTQSADATSGAESTDEEMP